MIQVLYHANCYDGFGAAWAARQALRKEKVNYQAVKYGDSIPGFDVFDTVFILDFSWPKNSMVAFLMEHKGQVVILDHHKTAQAELVPLVGSEGCTIKFDMEKSGAILTFEHFFPDTFPPLMLNYIQDRDLWHFTLSKSREVSQWMRSWPFDFEVWDELSARFGYDLTGIQREGESLLRFQNQMVSINADNAIRLTLGGHCVHAVNATLFFSEVGEELCRRYPDESFAGYWLDRADGKRQWGLRSRGGFDCSGVAKQYGGGGHPGASGFITEHGWLGDK